MAETAVKEKALKITSQEAKPLTDGETKALANKLMHSSKERQNVIMDEVYARCPGDIVKIFSQVISMVKSSIDSTSKDYQRFSDQCEAAQRGLNAVIEDKDASPEEKKEAREQTMEVIRLSKDALDKVQRSKTVETLTGCVLGGATLAAIVVVIKAMATSKKA